MDNVTAADRLIDRLVERMATRADFPRLGRARPEIAPGVRALVEGDHLILYRVDGRDVDIVRVVHGARRLTERFGPWDEG